ncbi:hypothetical protein CDAR_473261 [Caerostris darwini]|uniref:Uncharacterized protein n=1 Tax=Caerostris darwini TaxID=1538125 RepID=A0AAV4PM68_9ARAC|nr:hypothetical protein CDAR_473141 [Caerostris darwini]GIX97403.1 hypothetical protein CDAR_473261 [Caerostris darwini]
MKLPPPSPPVPCVLPQKTRIASSWVEKSFVRVDFLAFSLLYRGKKGFVSLMQITPIPFLAVANWQTLKRDNSRMREEGVCVANALLMRLGRGVLQLVIKFHLASLLSSRGRNRWTWCGHKGGINVRTMDPRWTVIASGWNCLWIRC